MPSNTKQSLYRLDESLQRALAAIFQGLQNREYSREFNQFQQNAPQEMEDIAVKGGRTQLPTGNIDIQKALPMILAGIASGNPQFQRYFQGVRATQPERKFIEGYRGQLGIGEIPPFGEPSYKEIRPPIPEKDFTPYQKYQMGGGGKIQDLEGDVAALEKQVQSIYIQSDVDKLFSGEEKLPQVPELRYDSATGQFNPTGKYVPDKFVIDYLGKRAELEKRTKKSLNKGGRNQADKVMVISPDGRRGKIPRSQLQEALKQGYKEVK